MNNRTHQASQYKLNNCFNLIAKPNISGQKIVEAKVLKKVRFNRVAKVLAIVLSPLLASGCNNPSSKVISETPSFDDSVTNDTKVMQDYLDNTHASIAANRNDVCPKLVTKAVDQSYIIRRHEHLPFGYCDYFLYPSIGDYITVTTTNDDLEALLMVPFNHNFANGGIRVDTQDKYVIRLQYNGVSAQPQNLTYDLKIDIN